MSTLTCKPDHEAATMNWPGMVRDKLTIRYNGKSYDKLFVCPCCGKETWQNLNFLGSRSLVCNGRKITKES